MNTPLSGFSTLELQYSNEINAVGYIAAKFLFQRVNGSSFQIT